MKRPRYESCILDRGAGFVVIAVLAGLLSLLSSACIFDTRTYLCEGKGVRCDVGQICMPNTDKGVCVDIGGCGDNNIDSGEECDDGNDAQEDGCNNNCKLPICGDGIRAGDEDCDDGNKLACGTCSADCKVVVPARAAATVDMSAVMVRDMNRFTLNDGFNNPSIFRFVYKIEGSEGSPTQRAGAHHLIQIGEPDPTDATGIPGDQVIDEMKQKIEAVGDILLIEATDNDELLTFKHSRTTGFGNQFVISEDIEGLSARLMGGTTADCLLGVGCMSDVDCGSDFCSEDGICEPRECSSHSDCLSNDCRDFSVGPPQKKGYCHTN